MLNLIDQYQFPASTAHESTYKIAKTKNKNWADFPKFPSKTNFVKSGSNNKFKIIIENLRVPINYPELSNQIAWSTLDG